MKRAFEPEELDHCLMGWPPPGPNGFHWRDGCLHYMNALRSSDPSEWCCVARPSQREWETFWTECGDLGVWDLPESFGNAMVIDGLIVHTVLIDSGRRLRVRGQCSGASEEIRQTVLAFHEALQELVGFADARNSR